MKTWNKKKKPKHSAKTTKLYFLTLFIELPNYSIKKSYYDKQTNFNTIITKYHKNNYHVC